MGRRGVPNLRGPRPGALDVGLGLATRPPASRAPAPPRRRRSRPARVVGLATDPFGRPAARGRGSARAARRRPIDPRTEPTERRIPLPAGAQPLALPNTLFVWV